MQPSLRIARILGPVLFVIGLGMLINGAAYREMAMQFVAGYPFIYFSGVLLLVAGMGILNAHNIWTRDWRSLITALALFMTGVGVFRILAPPYSAYLGSAMFSSGGFFIGAGGVFLALGAFIAFKGYVAEIS